MAKSSCVACEADARGITAGEALAIGIAIARRTDRRLCSYHALLKAKPPKVFAEKSSAAERTLPLFPDDAA